MMSEVSPANELNMATISPATIKDAIVQTVAYVDVFDYPLTVLEIHRYLTGIPASLETITELLQNGRLVPDRLHYHNGYYTLPGRQQIITTRQKREQTAQTLWPQAIRYGLQIAQLPFVRLVAVTGSLAVNNADRHADIDYLIVTENGRLWITRALTILIVRLAARHDIPLCPNYFLSERALVFTERTLYTARELAQMIPLAGFNTYYQLRQVNHWTNYFLPNACSLPPPTTTFLPSRLPKRPRFYKLAENLLRTRLGHYLETWEMQRKIRRFNRLYLTAHHTQEAAFSPDWCKGHVDGHGQHILASYDKRMESLSKT